MNSRLIAVPPEREYLNPFSPPRKQGKGTGLGLSMVYGVVKQLSGFLDVDSEPGQGSLFRIYFPAIPGSAAESSSVAAPQVGEMRGSETVLIGDDHESIREMARQTLASLGYRVPCERTAKKHGGFANKILHKSRCWTW
jgi:two-component system, cell cycle sensor histidine kinase and response regulator CckA